LALNQLQNQPFEVDIVAQKERKQKIECLLTKLREKGY